MFPVAIPHQMLPLRQQHCGPVQALIALLQAISRALLVEAMRRDGAPSPQRAVSLAHEKNSAPPPDTWKECALVHEMSVVAGGTTLEHAQSRAGLQCHWAKS